jgi:hypothetical protein
MAEVAAPNDSIGAAAAPSGSMGAAAAPSGSIRAAAAPSDSMGAAAAPNGSIGAAAAVAERDAARWSAQESTGRRIVEPPKEGAAAPTAMSSTPPTEPSMDSRSAEPRVRQRRSPTRVEMRETHSLGAAPTRRHRVEVAG